MAPHSSTLAWKIPWMEEPGGLQSMGSLRVGHHWVTSLSLLLSCIGEGNCNPLQCSCLEGCLNKLKCIHVINKCKILWTKNHWETFVSLAFLRYNLKKNYGKSTHTIKYHLTILKCIVDSVIYIHIVVQLVSKILLSCKTEIHYSPFIPVPSNHHSTLFLWVWLL